MSPDTFALWTPKMTRRIPASFRRPARKLTPAEQAFGSDTPAARIMWAWCRLTGRRPNECQSNGTYAALAQQLVADHGVEAVRAAIADYNADDYVNDRF